MRNRTAILSGAAVLTLAGAMAVTSPGYARVHHRTHHLVQGSTAAEKKQTAELNRQQQHQRRCRLRPGHLHQRRQYGRECRRRRHRNSHAEYAQNRIRRVPEHRSKQRCPDGQWRRQYEWDGKHFDGGPDHLWQHVEYQWNVGATADQPSRGFSVIDDCAKAGRQPAFCELETGTGPVRAAFTIDRRGRCRSRAQGGMS